MKFRLIERLSRIAFVLSLIVFISLISITNSFACDTPVYRYAMYKWLPAPYEVYFFHDADPSEEELEVRRAIEKYSENQQPTANLEYYPVNINDAGSLDSIHPRIKQAWLNQKVKELPSYMIVSPKGAQIHSGKLSASEVDTLVDSPARTKINSLLEKGNPGVLVMLDGKDEKVNQAAEKTLQELTTAVKAGKLDLFTPPETNPGDPPAEEPKVKPEISMIRISPEDEKEQWLIRSLLAIEEDLKEEELRKQPMVFIAYGRGRALPPFIGKGITFENVAEDIAFISGACSCTVKEQNPGVDLLTRYDWDAAAENLTELFGSEEGNEGNLSDLFPEIISTEELEARQVASNEEGSIALASNTLVENSVGDDSTSSSTDSQSVPEAHEDETVENSESSSAVVQEESSNRSLMLTMVVGLVAGFVALVAVSFFLLKPR